MLSVESKWDSVHLSTGTSVSEPMLLSAWCCTDQSQSCHRQVKNVTCMMSRPSWMLVGHHLGHACGDIALFRATHYLMDASLRRSCGVSLCDHSCLLRSVLFERLTFICLKILYDRCEFSFHMEGYSCASRKTTFKSHLV